METEIAQPPDEKWLFEEPGRTAVFQAWMDSLEIQAVKRIKVQVDGTRPHNNYASFGRL